MKRMTKGKFPTTQILGVVAGSVAAGMVEKLVTKLLPTSTPYVRALIPVAAGVFLAMQKNEIVKGAGFGMVAAGGSALVDAFMPKLDAAGNPITGVDDYFMSEMDEFMGSPADQSILSAPADQSILSGFADREDDFLNGDEEFMNAYDGGSYED
jgi:hypothetical protein